MKKNNQSQGEQTKKSNVHLIMSGKKDDIIYYKDIKELFDYFMSKGYEVYFRKCFSDWEIIIKNEKE